MEERTESPMAVKVEKHSQSTILTYFHGDTNSMVDAHFSRALGTVSRDKGPAKMKKMRKSIKEKSTDRGESTADAYPMPQLPTGGLLNLSPMDDTPDTWHPFTARAAESAGLPSIAYSLSPERLSLAGQRYATSLLNLLHNEQADAGPSLASSSKPELHHSWMEQPGLREPVDPAMVFKPGQCLDKKDLYWY
ncbi:unnamed protein product [Tetraodon nigroviridis]|uniref:(spotted green pufferfish) hypothetical protein n=1 Tax=Tetraodon nigroviridis TaxID=99883 RepID=Q4RP54_TETNG|nr:unnamed protein product [Tetraodon nigroviridis]